MTSLEKEKKSQEIDSIQVFEKVTWTCLALIKQAFFFVSLLCLVLDAENITWRNTDVVLTSTELFRGKQTTNLKKKNKTKNMSYYF